MRADRPSRPAAPNTLPTASLNAVPNALPPTRPAPMSVTSCRPATTLLAVGALAVLGGCTVVTSGPSAGDPAIYRAQSVKTAPLDVPPDLSQLNADGRYAPQVGGSVSANALQQQRGSVQGSAPATAGTDAVVAPSRIGSTRIEREGQVRWLVSPLPPEQLYPQLKAFWSDQGLPLVEDLPAVGVMQTDWAENRAKLPDDILRRTLGNLIDRLYSTGERDAYRTRVERRADGGSEVYISHRGLQEVLVGARDQESTRWQPRAADPGLEQEMLARLLLRLGGVGELAQARTVAAAPGATAASQAAAGPSTAARPRTPLDLPADAPVTLSLEEGFDRAWRQIGLALDRSGFTVEDRDRRAGLYFVRYIDPRAPQEEPGFFTRMFSSKDDALLRSRQVQRYRLALQTRPDGTLVSVQTAEGQPETGDAARQIVARLIDALR
ncbi:MAG: hypothetical protein RL223_3173 [Pseudomonadota bacterium]